MKLSEAIRLGATMKPQCFDKYHAYNDDGATVGSCALGAAADAINFDIDDRAVFSQEWENLLSSLTDLGCPACAELGGRSVIPHLNDDHRWSRERIADWVELHEGLPVVAEAAEDVKVAQ